MGKGNFLQQVRILETSQGKSKPLAQLSMNNIPIYKGMWTQTQWRTEEMLIQYLTTLPDLFRGPSAKMRIERSMEFQQIIENGNDAVKCTVLNKASGTTETISAKFLIGADGGRSSIRKGLGFEFAGEATNEYFFALHAGLNNYVGNRETMDVFFSKGDDPDAGGFAFTMPMPDGGYLITMDLDLQQQRRWQTGETDRFGGPVLKQPDQYDIIDILKQRGCGENLSVKEGSVNWLAHFRVQSRQADAYRKGRVFIAGDACHCHSPLGGQGMNMGFLDAKNLAWKIGSAVKNPGKGAEKLLGSYDVERRGVDQKILRAIEHGQKMASGRNPVLFFLRGRGQRLLGHFSSIAAGPGKLMSQQA